MPQRAERFDFPYYDPKLRVRQPDYKRWQSIKIGMSRIEVIARLGRPLRDPYLSPQPEFSVYGYLQMPLMPHIRTYYFYIQYDEELRVESKADPFGGVFSIDGKPSRPIILAPTPGAEFCHYPRIVDLRWHPVSGKYPMRYEIEIGYGEFGTEDPEFFDEIQETSHPFPYYVTEFSGDSPGRFRVRAINSLGKGKWSEHRHFDFSRGMLRS